MSSTKNTSVQVCQSACSFISVVRVSVCLCMWALMYVICAVMLILSGSENRHEITNSIQIHRKLGQGGVINMRVDRNSSRSLSEGQDFFHMEQALFHTVA